VRRAKKALVVLGVTLGAIAVLLSIAYVVIDEPLPEGRAGQDAEALASRLERAVDTEAWARTGAVEWTFAGRNTHLWDRTRALVRVRWDDTEVLLRESPSGRAYRAGVELTGDEAQAALDDAYARFINDAFWLNPLAKLRDPGVTRGTVELGRRRQGLLVTYTSGGLTPGDSYLWVPGERDLPRAWKMWVSILPVGGVETSWEGWITLSTGAKIATRHAGPLGMAIELTNVRGAATLAELVEGPDPFAPLLEAEPSAPNE
jgi:hypothetical protein